MAPPTLLQLAQQGDPQAIAALLNRQLQPQGVTAKVAVRKDGLHVLLESATQVPDRKAFVDTIRTQLSKWEPAEIERVKVYGRQVGEKEAAWSQEFALEFGAYSMMFASQTRDASSSPAPTAPENSPPNTPQNQLAAKRQNLLPLLVGAIAACGLLGAAAFFAYKYISTSGNNPAPEVSRPSAPSAPNP